jgi:hypothetical protein
MEQKLVRITKLAPRPWWAAIAPLLMAAGLIFPPIALWLAFEQDAVEASLKKAGLENDRLAGENSSLKERLCQFESPPMVQMKLATWPALIERDRSSACHACSSLNAFDRRFGEMILFQPADSTFDRHFGASATWYQLRSFTNADIFWPDGI